VGVLLVGEAVWGLAEGCVCECECARRDVAMLNHERHSNLVSATLCYVCMQCVAQLVRDDDATLYSCALLNGYLWVSLGIMK
jgi:hypothetical protein